MPLAVTPSEVFCNILLMKGTMTLACNSSFEFRLNSMIFSWR